VLLYFALTYRVVAVRRREKIGIADGGNKELQRLIRVHGNAAETLPIGLLLLVLSELNGLPVWWLHSIGAALLVGRALHAIGLGTTAGVSFGRSVGTLLTWIAWIAGALALLGQYLLAAL
jgi:uncharacterized protein